jgi:hypothetical protein
MATRLFQVVLEAPVQIRETLQKTGKAEMGKTGVDQVYEAGTMGFDIGYGT